MKPVLLQMFLAVKDEQLVVDKNIITSTGPATSLNVAFKLLEMLTDIKHVDEIK